MRLVRVLTLMLALGLVAGCLDSATPTVQPTITASPTASRVPSPTPTAASNIPPTQTASPQPTASPTPTGAPTPVPLEVEDSAPPDRDLYALAQRLVLKSVSPISRVVNPAPVSYTEGRTDTFFVTDILAQRVNTVMATLQVVSEHAYWYVDDRASLPLGDLRRASSIFEQEIYPRVTEVFGTEWRPGVDNDTHLTILHTPLRGVAGYYSASDEYPIQIHQFSNEREMIYISTRGLTLASDGYLGTLAHELTHAIHWRADPTEDTWINEGLAEIGKELAGYRSLFRSSFLATPSVSLTLWPDSASATVPHYGGASLFLDYLAQQYSGYESLRILLDQPANGIRGVQAYLREVGAGKEFEEVFADWVVANYLDDPEGGPYSYPSRDVRVSVSDVVETARTIKGETPQYGAVYIDVRLDAPEVIVVFRGESEVALLPQGPPDGGSCWWGNRGDSIDATLTGRFHLPATEDLTLTYSLWYDVEENWDYTYAEISTDEGITWDLLEGNYTSPANPVGNAFGPGYTGQSGGWLKEEIDLTPYAGQEVLLRFEYVTDDSLHGPGVCFDDIAIPAIGFLDDAEESSEVWESRGFVRTGNNVPQKYVLRVIELGTETRVRDIELDEQQQATLLLAEFGTRVDHAVIVIAGQADGTTLPAAFELEVRPSRE